MERGGGSAEWRGGTGFGDGDGVGWLVESIRRLTDLWGGYGRIKGGRSSSLCGCALL